MARYQQNEMSDIEIFISHSSADREIAAKLITLLRSALNVPAQKIRCTSVDGFRLPAGMPIEEQLRTEIYNSNLFIAIITMASMKSVYVLFELGARWGTQKPLIPILARGAHAKVLAGPLSTLNALRCDEPAQLHQLIEDISRTLGRTKESAAAYHKCIVELVEANKNSKNQMTAKPNYR